MRQQGTSAEGAWLIDKLLTDAGGQYKHDGRPTGRRTILQWTNNMGGWSVARSDSPSCLLNQAPDACTETKTWHSLSKKRGRGCEGLVQWVLYVP